MVLKRISILNYKNVGEATLDFSPKVNCFIGQNGAGKTNLLDAVYYLSFCHSAFTSQDSQVIRHDAPFFVIEGDYEDVSCTIPDATQTINVYCGMKRGTKKHFKRDKKEYKRLSQHIGLIPLVMLSPSDVWLIEGGGEERRKLMDVVISQYDNTYIETLNRYNKALLQRNSLLKMEEEPDLALMTILEEQMAVEGERIYQSRMHFVEELVPVFQQIYQRIADNREQVSLTYVSHCQRGALLDVIQRDRHKDRAVGYSLHGIHRDDLVMMLGDYPMRREGSQGQNKTFVTALKLAQFSFLREKGHRTTPILLLDDIFDKLDAHRVEQIVNLVSSDEYGQIFITDTNREHLDRIISHAAMDYKIFTVDNGEVTCGTACLHDNGKETEEGAMSLNDDV